MTEQIEGDKAGARRLVNAVSEHLFFEQIFYQVDVRVVFFENVDFVRVEEFTVTADRTFGILLADNVLGVAASLELFKYDRCRLLID